ncbi:hypothetical protein FOL47_002636 [Perkinsus chesapeaki]|uniref:Uncharacterized protein n=1 Tax=Perkinsus chesapeaki TaxID=330153 RepID=A0A7J6MCX8_PERCH|nr:hypothetical protein FOL47_002636 [Perkinsus chesapeaki]
MSCPTVVDLEPHHAATIALLSRERSLMYKRIDKLERKQKAAIEKFRRQNQGRDTETTEMLLSILALQKEYRNQAVVCDTLVAAWKSPGVDVTSSRCLPHLEGKGKRKISITIPTGHTRDLSRSYCQQVQTDKAVDDCSEWWPASDHFGPQDSHVASTVAESPSRGGGTHRSLCERSTPRGWSPRTDSVGDGKRKAEPTGPERPKGVLRSGTDMFGMSLEETSGCPMCGCSGLCADVAELDRRRSSVSSVDGSCQTGGIARKDSGVGNESVVPSGHSVAIGTRLVIRKSSLVGEDIPRVASSVGCQAAGQGKHSRNAETQTPITKHRSTAVDAATRIECSAAVTQTPTSQYRSTSCNTSSLTRKHGATDTRGLMAGRESGTQTPVLEYRTVKLGGSPATLADTGCQHEDRQVRRSGASQTPAVVRANKGVDPPIRDTRCSVTQTPPPPRCREMASGGSVMVGVGASTDTNGLYGCSHTGTQTPEQELAYRDTLEGEDRNADTEVWGLEVVSAPDAVIREIWGHHAAERIRLTDSSSCSSGDSFDCVDDTRAINDVVDCAEPLPIVVSGAGRSARPRGTVAARAAAKRGLGIHKGRGRKVSHNHHSSSSRNSPRHYYGGHTIDQGFRDRFAQSASDLIESLSLREAVSSQSSAHGTSDWLKYDTLGQNIRWRAVNDGEEDSSDIIPVNLMKSLVEDELPREIPVMLDEEPLVEVGEEPERNNRVLAKLYTSPNAREGVLIELPSEVFVEWAKHAWGVSTRTEPIIPKSRSWLTEEELEKREGILRSEGVVVTPTRRLLPMRQRPVLWFPVRRQQFGALRAVLGITPRLFPVPKPIGRHGSLTYR